MFDLFSPQSGERRVGSALFLLLLALGRRAPLQRRPVRQSGPLQSRRRAGLSYAGSVCRTRRARRRLDLPLPILLLPIFLAILLPVLLARRLRRAGTLRQAVLPLRTGLARRIVALVISVRIGLPQRALPAAACAGDGLLGMNLRPE